MWFSQYEITQKLQKVIFGNGNKAIWIKLYTIFGEIIGIVLMFIDQDDQIHVGSGFSMGLISAIYDYHIPKVWFAVGN